jgi:hypothetical protein
VSGLGERGERLRRVARALSSPPAVPPFYVQSPAPDDEEVRAIGWYMRRSAEVWLREELGRQRKSVSRETPVAKRNKKRQKS